MFRKKLGPYRKKKKGKKGDKKKKKWIYPIRVTFQINFSIYFKLVYLSFYATNKVLRESLVLSIFAYPSYVYGSALLAFKVQKWLVIYGIRKYGSIL